MATYNNRAHPDGAVWWKCCSVPGSVGGSVGQFAQTSADWLPRWSWYTGGCNRAHVSWHQHTVWYPFCLILFPMYKNEPWFDVACSFNILLCFRKWWLLHSSWQWSPAVVFECPHSYLHPYGDGNSWWILNFLNFRLSVFCGYCAYLVVTMTFTTGKNQISVDAAVKFVKLLFRYEQWDVFCSLSNNLVTVLSVSQLVKS